MPFVALAGIGVIGEALVALAILAGVLLIGYLIARFGSYVPLIGAWLAAKATEFIQYAVSSLDGTLQGALYGLSNLVSVVVVVVTFPFNAIRRFAVVSAFGFIWVRDVAIPRGISAVYSWTASNLIVVENFATSLYNQAIATVYNALSLAYNYSLTLYYQAIAFGNLVLQDAYNYSATLYNGAIVYIGQRVDAVTSLLYSAYGILNAALANLRQELLAAIALSTQALTTAMALLEQRLTALITQYAAAAERDALHIVDVDAAAALTAVWPGIISDVDGIIEAVPGELTDVLDGLRAIPRAIPGSLTDAIAGIGALSIPMLDYLKDCGVPMCGNLHGLSDLLGGLLDAGTDAALLALIIEAARDPQAAARDINDIASPIVHGAEDLFNTLVGR